jgi:hypothetical protein
MKYMWQVAFPDLAKQLPSVGDTPRPVSLVSDLSFPPSVKNSIMQFHKRPDLINNWCLALLNSQVHRCSIDGEWTTERRMNGGPGRKQGKLAVLSVSYLAPDTPRGLTQLLDIVPYCRVGVFQIASLEELPRYLLELIQTATIKKTGKVLNG